MPQRRERDDKVHDSIIEERIQRERPCRTLFIRNIKASLSTKLSLLESGHLDGSVDKSSTSITLELMCGLNHFTV